MTDPTADAAKLLPCPSVICPSHHPDWDEGNVSGLLHRSVGFCVECYECSASTSVFKTREEAITAWNTRPQPAPLEGEPDDAAALADRILAAIHNSNEMDHAAAAQVIAEWRYMQASCAPLAPSSAMIEAGAQRLVRWEDDSVWPTSWNALEVADARNEAERVWRSMWLAARKSSPTPSDGEPDFEKLGNCLIELVKAGVSATWVHVELERMYRLGLAARPKVEDAVDDPDPWKRIEHWRKAAFAAEAKLVELKEADIQCVKDIARLTIERDEAREKLAEREAELAAVLSDIGLRYSPNEVARRHAARQQQKA